MKNRKALFFDIDGTLFSEILRQVPQSAVLALKKRGKREIWYLLIRDVPGARTAQFGKKWKWMATAAAAEPI